jgi:hypothetical protein
VSLHNKKGVTDTAILGIKKLKCGTRFIVISNVSLSETLSQSSIMHFMYNGEVCSIPDFLPRRLLALYFYNLLPV